MALKMQDEACFPESATLNVFLFLVLGKKKAKKSKK